MRRFLTALGFALALSSIAEAQNFNNPIGDFAGTWRNSDQYADIAMIDIRVLNANTARVEVWGRCGPRECSFGSATGKMFAANPARASAEESAAILVKFNRAPIGGDVLIRLGREGEIVTHAMLTFKDRRGSVYSVNRYQIDADYGASPEADGHDGRWRNY